MKGQQIIIEFHDDFFLFLFHDLRLGIRQETRSIYAARFRARCIFSAYPQSDRAIPEEISPYRTYDLNS